MANAECRTQNAEKARPIQERTFEFACRIVKLHALLIRSGDVARPLAMQLLKAATSIGANLEEAEAGQSRADFTAKCRISLKEARESLYWLRLFAATGIVKPALVESLVSEANEIVSILTTIVKKASSPRPP